MGYDLLDALAHIDPAQLDYDDWTRVGMALHAEGFTADQWGRWSQSDKRFKPGECESKWSGFHSDGGIRGGTIVELARRQGYSPRMCGLQQRPQPLGRPGGHRTPEPPDQPTPRRADPLENLRLAPTEQAATALGALFEPGEYFAIAYDYLKEGKPTVRCPDADHAPMTCGEFIEALCAPDHLDLDSIFAIVRPPTGNVFLCANPIDGKGCKAENITAHRHVIVESDANSLEEQRGVIESLNLPVATMTYSGGKSIHSLIRVDAPDLEEFNRRRDLVYAACESRGLKVDRACKDPAHLTRFPGFARTNGDGRAEEQTLLAANVGAASWEVWETEWNRRKPPADGLPPIARLGGRWNRLPPRPAEIIEGVLRVGHSMLISGPSKAGKTYLLIELACAIVEGLIWLGWRIKMQGPVVYINMELCEETFLHRVEEIYRKLGWEKSHINDIIPWQLRGYVVDVRQVVDGIIERIHVMGLKPVAVIIDPLYTIMDGDENSAGDVTRALNEIGRISRETGCAVVYSHHFAKGAAGAKAAMDRSCGSGAFQRFPDAALTLTPLKTDPTQGPHPAFRLESVLREFPPFEPKDVWFKHPIHMVDDTGTLEGCAVVGSPQANSEQASEAKAKKAERDHGEINAMLEEALKSLESQGTTATKANVAIIMAGQRKPNGDTVKDTDIANWVKSATVWCPFRSRGGVIYRYEEGAE